MKKNILLTMMSMAVVFLIASCGTTSKTTQNTIPDAHNSRNSLDWAGVYEGILPCADCEGIKTTLQLKENGHYKLGIKYLGTKQKFSSEESGSFTWNEEGQKITLENGTQYFVGENKIARLDQDGNKVTGALAGHYILGKMDGQLTETYWKLVTLNGNTVEMDSTFNREPHLILREKDHRVSGNAGCNQIMGSYSLDSGNQIDFSQMATTLMACPNLKDERAFLNTLEKVDHYAVYGEELVLKSGTTTVATFKSVYFH